jgi:hypothetical protein
MKEPLEACFLRHSRHLNPDLGGYRDHASAQAVTVAATAVGNPPVHADALVVVSDPSPLPCYYLGAVLICSHLPLSTIQGMAMGFLKMQPEAVSAAAFLELDDDDDAEA